jgi:hypothetical protein
MNMNQEKANITLQDIALMVTIIDATTKRGAIEGNELSIVGSLRDKLDRFVKENTPEQPPEQEATAEERGAE